MNLEELPIEIYPKDLEQAYIDGYQKCFNDAKEIIRNLCNAIRALNNPNTQLTNIDELLSEAEQLLNDDENNLLDCDDCPSKWVCSTKNPYREECKGRFDK